MDTTSRRKIFSTLSIGTAAAAIGAGTAVTLKAQPNTTQSLTTLINSFVPGVGGFIGTLQISNVALVNGLLTATGTLSGNVLNGTGAVLGSITQAVSVPLQVSGSCQILTLTLGPLDLNLLGLAVHLNQVVLTITAVPGAGNLLGNLLCAIANLLNNPGTLQNLLSNLVSLLNQILAAL
jgi:hypothetical protein